MNARPFARKANLIVLFVSAVLACGACSRNEPAPAPVAVQPAPPPPPPAPPPEPPPPRELPPDATVLPAEDRAFLQAQGLDLPEAELIADLRAHPELIRCEGLAGGTPGFHDPEAIRVLDRSHVQAQFDDGHVVGNVDLTFTVKRGNIAWKVQRIDCGEAESVARVGSP